MTLLRLKRAINEPQYQAAFVDIVCNRRAQLRRSTAPVTWLPQRPVGAEAETASVLDSTPKSDFAIEWWLSGQIHLIIPFCDALLMVIA